MIDRFKSKPRFFRGKKIAVIGLGVEGVSNVRFLVKNGAKVTILDKKKEAEIDKELFNRVKNLNVNFVFGQNYLKNLSAFDLVVRSPGVKLELLEKYVSRDKITSQTKLFFDLCPCPIIGVTGTKGKGTTVSLIYEMLRKQSS